MVRSAFRLRFLQATHRVPLCSIVMEYADGGDLQQLVNKHKDAGTFMGEDEALGYFVQICLGLKHIHDKSIVHRDIKSPNVFLTKDGLVKLGDFGVAKALDHTAAMAQTQIGTPYYLSPEIVAGEQYNRKTDVSTAAPRRQYSTHTCT